MSRVLLVCAAAVLAYGQSPRPEPAAQRPDGGPLELVITYRCPPPRRAAFRQYMLEGGIQRFEHWKQDGLLKDYRFLFNWYVDVDSWDAMAVLSFPSYDRIPRWKEIEHANPGGLSRDALELAWPLNSNPADLAWFGASEQQSNPAAAVYYVVAFDNPATGDIRDFASSYILPKAKGLLRQGVLASYNIFVNRYPSAKRWPALMILEYKDVDAFSRDAAPAWKAPEGKPLSNEPVIADAIFGH